MSEQFPFPLPGWTAEQEAEARAKARAALAEKPRFYNPSAAHGVDGPNYPHTEETLWPYYVPGWAFSKV